MHLDTAGRSRGTTAAPAIFHLLHIASLNSSLPSASSPGLQTAATRWDGAAAPKRTNGVSAHRGTLGAASACCVPQDAVCPPGGGWRGRRSQGPPETRPPTTRSCWTCSTSHRTPPSFSCRATRPQWRELSRPWRMLQQQRAQTCECPCCPAPCSWVGPSLRETHPGPPPPRDPAAPATERRQGVSSARLSAPSTRHGRRTGHTCAPLASATASRLFTATACTPQTRRGSCAGRPNCRAAPSCCRRAGAVARCRRACCKRLPRPPPMPRARRCSSRRGGGVPGCGAHLGRHCAAPPLTASSVLRMLSTRRVQRWTASTALVAFRWRRGDLRGSQRVHQLRRGGHCLVLHIRSGRG